MPRGIVKWFSQETGVGVLSQDCGLDDCRHRDAPDIAAEESAVLGPAGARALEEGEQVVFDIAQDQAGLRADNIRRLPSDGTVAGTGTGPGPENGTGTGANGDGSARRRLRGGDG